MIWKKFTLKTSTNQFVGLPAATPGPANTSDIKLQLSCYTQKLIIASFVLIHLHKSKAV